MAHKQHELIFRAGSRTYYNSSRFFPREVREDVFVLYGFVRVADNFVDSRPRNESGFHEFCRLYREASEQGTASGDLVIDSFAELEKRKKFDPEWTRAFLHSMEMDLTKQVYSTLDETLEYIYGSAEVIGLFMASIMDLPQEAYHSASMLGRAMQYINFIRDIDEDAGLGRQYIPLTGTNLPDLKRHTAEKHPEAFRSFIRGEISRYRSWQEEAQQGYSYIPGRYRIPVKTAADMYRWTAAQIEREPMTVFQKKVKPGKPRIILQGIRNFLGGTR